MINKDFEICDLGSRITLPTVSRTRYRVIIYLFIYPSINLLINLFTHLLIYSFNHDSFTQMLNHFLLILLKLRQRYFCNFTSPKEMNFCHKLKFSNPLYLLQPLIFQTYTISSEMIHSSKFQRSMSTVCKDIGIKKSKKVINIECLGSNCWGWHCNGSSRSSCSNHRGK